MADEIERRPRAFKAATLFAAAIVSILGLSLQGCDSGLSAVLLPMEPTSDAIVAPRRELTAAEKQTIEAAVSAVWKTRFAPEIQWSTLVMLPHERVLPYCGIVSRNDVDESYQGYSRYYSQVNLDGAGKIRSVNSLTIRKSVADGLKTEIDSLCAQAGYAVR